MSCESFWKCVLIQEHICFFTSAYNVICSLGLSESLTSVKLLNLEHLQTCSTMKAQFLHHRCQLGLQVLTAKPGWEAKSFTEKLKTLFLGLQPKECFIHLYILFPLGISSHLLFFTICLLLLLHFTPSIPLFPSLSLLAPIQILISLVFSF